jgi:hypothetical protein
MLTDINVADMNPAIPIISHLKISSGTIERHCSNSQMVRKITNICNYSKVSIPAVETHVQ